MHIPACKFTLALGVGARARGGACCASRGTSPSVSQPSRSDAKPCLSPSRRGWSGVIRMATWFVPEANPWSSPEPPPLYAMVLLGGAHERTSTAPTYRGLGAYYRILRPLQDRWAEPRGSLGSPSARKLHPPSRPRPRRPRSILARAVSRCQSRCRCGRRGWAQSRGRSARMPERSADHARTTHVCDSAP
jgi:hypothetical protein